MALRRLTVKRNDGDAPCALTGVPAPVRSPGRACALAQVLEICLDHVGLRLGYDTIMGLSGLALRAPHLPDDDALAAEERVALKTLAGTLTPALRVHEPAPDDALRLVIGAIDAGLPCAALGWGSEKEAWAVICGYDRGRGRLLGHCLLDHPRMEYESWPAELSLLVTLDGPPRLQGREAIRSAVVRAAQSWHRDVGRAWERWIAASAGAPPGTAPALSDDRPHPAAAYSATAALLIDARAAAERFARVLAERQEPLPAAWLMRAAERFAREIELLESTMTGGVEEFAESEQREAWADRLTAAARLDEAGFADLRRAWSADFGPEEAELP